MSRVAVAPILRLEPGRSAPDQDLVAVEAPLSVILRHARGQIDLGVIMRTPGDDRDLVMGLLLAEGLIARSADVVAVDIVAEVPASADAPAGSAETCTVQLAPEVEMDERPARVLTSTSACGLCGRLGMQAIDRRGRSGRDDGPVPAALIAALPAKLREHQTAFAATGGLHAAALFDRQGTPIVVREDVGRHNAVDKVVGAALVAGRVPADDTLLAVSGRIAFEIVQKAAMAGVPIVVAVGAPSSLAVEAARAAGMTLAGFARDGRFNLYAAAHRVGIGDSE